MVTKRVCNAELFGEKDKRTEVIDYFAGMEKLAKVRERMKEKEKLTIKKEKKTYFD